MGGSFPDGRTEYIDNLPFSSDGNSCNVPGCGGASGGGYCRSGSGVGGLPTINGNGSYCDAKPVFSKNPFPPTCPTPPPNTNAP